MAFIMKSRLSSFAGAAFCALTLALPAMADAPAGYYDSLEGKTGVELKKAVKALVKSHHKRITYGNSTWEAFRLTDVREENGVKYWWDMYSNEKVKVGSSKPDNAVMNIEHSVAKSWWGGGTNDAYCDICHLNPSNSKANSQKSNYPMAKIGNVTWTNGVTIIGSPVSGQGGGSSKVYEPCDDYKGDMARVFMYMFTVYDDLNWGTNTSWMYDTSSELTLKPWAYNMLLEWSANDAVSQKERDRNDGIYKSNQKSRNPFIDLPDLADYIWGSKKGQPYHVDGAHNPDPIDPDPVDPDPVDPTPEDPDLTAGTYVLVASQSDIRAGEDYIILDAEGDHGLSTMLDGKVFKNTDVVPVSGNIVSALPSDIAIINLEQGGSGWYMKMSDINGANKGYMSSSTTKTMTLSSTPSSSVTISVAAAGTTVSFGNVGNFMYNASAPRFTTYTSNQTLLKFYRKVKETSGVEEVEEIDDSCLVEVWGNNILVPDGASIYDLNGRKLMSGENLARGIYLVASPTLRKTLKVMIK